MLGKASLPGLPTIWIMVRQGPIALAVGAGGVCSNFFLLSVFFLSPSMGDSLI